MKRKTRNKLVNGFENIIYWIAILGAILSLLGIITVPICHFTIHLHNCAASLASLGVISTGCSAVWFFISKRKDDKLKYAVELVKDFDNKELRQSRELTRRIKPLWDKKEIKPKVLADLIDGINKENSEIMQLQKSCNIESAENLKGSLIFLFNYWQSVYSALKYNLVKDEYILKHLSNTFASQYERFHYWFERYSKDNDMQQFKDLEEFDDIAKEYLKQQGDK